MNIITNAITTITRINDEKQDAGQYPNDLAMLIAIALVSVSGFILEAVIPSRHAVRMHGADSWCSHLCGLG